MSRYGVEDLGGWRLGAKANKEGSPIAKIIVKLGNGWLRIWCVLECDQGFSMEKIMKSWAHGNERCEMSLKQKRNRSVWTSKTVKNPQIP